MRRYMTSWLRPIGSCKLSHATSTACLAPRRDVHRIAYVLLVYAIILAANDKSKASSDIAKALLRSDGQELAMRCLGASEHAWAPDRPFE